MPATSTPLLTARSRFATLTAVTLAHLAAGWALIQADAPAPQRPVAPTLTVRMISPAPAPVKPPEPPAPAPPVIPKQTPPTPKPVVAAKPKPKPQPAPEPFTAPPPPPAEPAPPIAPAPAPDPTDSQAPTAPAAAPQLVNAGDLGCSRIDPIYPQISQQLGEKGTVVLQVLIDVQGKVLEVTVQQSSGFPRLDRVASTAAKQMRCKNSHQAPVRALLPVNFEIQQD